MLLAHSGLFGSFRVRSITPTPQTSPAARAAISAPEPHLQLEAECNIDPRTLWPSMATASGASGTHDDAAATVPTAVPQRPKLDDSAHAQYRRTQRRLVFGARALLEPLSLFSLVFSGVVRLNMWGLLYVALAGWLSGFSLSEKPWGIRVWATRCDLARAATRPEDCRSSLGAKGVHGGTGAPAGELTMAGDGALPKQAERGPTSSCWQTGFERKRSDRRYAVRALPAPLERPICAHVAHSRNDFPAAADPSSLL